MPIDYSTAEGVARITLNRPEKLNTLNEAVIQGLADAIDAQGCSWAGVGLSFRRRSLCARAGAPRPGQVVQRALDIV